MEPATIPEQARTLLREAMQRHAQREIDAAIAIAKRAVALAPGFAEGHAYLGNTLVTRKRRFADGLAALRDAVELSPDDATILYTTGWCEEYVANALERPRQPHQAVDEGAAELYQAARVHFLRALAAGPDDQLRGDIEDMLDVVAAATGEPWEDEAPSVAAPSSGERSSRWRS